MPTQLTPRIGIAAIDGSDCVDCGRCCHHEPSTVMLHEEDEIRFGEEKLKRLTVLMSRPPHFRFFDNRDGHCTCLDTSTPDKYPCGVYEIRPSACRIVEAGSPCCYEARQLGHLGKLTEYYLKTDWQRLPEAAQKLFPAELTAQLSTS